MPLRRATWGILVVLGILAIVVFLLLEVTRPDSILRSEVERPNSRSGLERIMEEYRDRGPVRPLPPPPR